MVESRVKTVKAEMKRLAKAIDAMENAHKPFDGVYWGPKETGAVRRASMDLTRALAELRKSRY